MEQKLVFFKGISSDMSAELMPEGVGRWRLNCRVMSSENGDDQSAEIPRGNTLVSFSLPTGANTVIGTYENKKTKMVYYFVHNTSHNHLILEYNTVANTIAKVFQDSVNILNGQTNILNFQLDHLITGVNVVELDSDNHLLYWSDGYISDSNPNVYNEPRKINIEKGKYFMAGNHTLGYKTPFNPEILFRIKQPSECGPTYIWAKGLHEIQVTSNITQDSGTDPNLAVPPGGDVTVRFNVIQFDASSEFDITTYTWTVGETNQYSLAATVNAATDVLGLGDGTLSLFVNGVAVQTVSIAPLLTTAFGGTNFTVQEDSISLTVGDTVTVVIANLQNATSLTVLGKSFTSQIKKVNFLFKQFPVFKTQFVYDDNDVSSWSAWSPYVFPNVVHDTATGNDIITQDDTINVIVDTGINIVTKIRIAVKMLGQRLVNNVLENIEFSLIAELNKSILQIADDSTYSFIFLNDGNYTPLYINESIKLYDSVPLASKSQELIIDGRIVDGLITEGQNPVNIDMIMNLSFIDIGTFSNWVTALAPATFLKSGGIYKYGIVYYDHANRSGLTNIQRGASTVLLPNGNYGTTLYVPFLTETGYDAPHNTPNTDMSYVPQVNMNIYNAPPSWATHFQIVRSKNEAITKYFQFAAQDITYVDTSGTVVSPSVATDLYVYINNITGRYLSENGKSSLVYDFTPGDRIRFIANATGGGTSYTSISAFFSFNDTEILSYDASNGIVHIKMTSDVPLTMDAGTLFEIYTPARNVINDNEFIYEIGECYPLILDTHGNLVHTFSGTDQLIVASSSNTFASPIITAQVVTGHGLIFGDNVKIVGSGWSIYGLISVANATNVHIDTTGFTMTGSHTNGASTIYKAATGVLKSGDCFRVYQNMPWINTGVVYRLYSFVENMNASNLWTSNAWDYARPNRVDDNFKRITRQSTVIWSESFVPETFINGLSTVYDTNFQTYEQRYGGIYKLYNENLFLDIFQELKCSRVPIQQSVFIGTQGESVVGQSTEVLPRVPSYYQGEFGIGTHPESFAVFGPAKYFIDVYRGVVLRLSNDGLTPISDTNQMHNYFSNKCKDVLNYESRVNIYGTYDVKFGEYIISFQGKTGVISNFEGDTLAFNEDENQWSTHYSYLPDFMCTNGINIISFKNGSLYTHNTNAIYNNFYGVQYDSKLWFYCNLSPSNKKVFKAISLEGLHPWAMVMETPISEEDLAGQTTALLDSNFQRKEGFWYADLLMDDNTPNTVVGPPLLPNARFEGNPMRGVYALVKLTYSGTAYNKLFACNILVVPSERSNK